MSSHPPFSPSILVLPALSLERTALLTVLETTGTVFLPDNNGSLLGRVLGKGGYHDVAISPCARGNVCAALQVEEMTRQYPSIEFILLFGIAGGGLRTRIADVVISNRVISISTGRKNPRRFQFRGLLPEPSKDLLALADQLLLTTAFAVNSWKDYVRRILDSPAVSSFVPLLKAESRLRERRVPSIISGTVASSDQVINCKRERSRWTRPPYYATAFETEAQGVAIASRYRQYLVVRGISDMADGGKNNKTDRVTRPIAAHIAAGFLTFLLRHVPPRSGHPNHGTPSTILAPDNGGNSSRLSGTYDSVQGSGSKWTSWVNGVQPQTWSWRLGNDLDHQRLGNDTSFGVPP